MNECFAYRCKTLDSDKWESFVANNALEAVKKACEVLGDVKENIFLEAWNDSFSTYEEVLTPSVLTMTVSIKIHLTRQDAEDIITTAFYGGVNHWVDHVKKIGGFLGETAAEHLANGGKLQLFDSESDDIYELDLKKLIIGFKKWVENGGDEYGAVSTEGVDCCNIDAGMADEIIQYALFGEVVFG